MVGSPFDDDPEDSGSAYVLRSDDDWATWSRIKKLTANDAAVNASLGYSVAIAGETVVVGSYLDDDPINSGSAYVLFSAYDC